jgi:hypothetical protein
MVRNFLLHCEPNQQCYTLEREGETWTRTFQSLEEAIREARRRAGKDEVQLIVYNESGRVIIDTTL